MATVRVDEPLARNQPTPFSQRGNGSLRGDALRYHPGRWLSRGKPRSLPQPHPVFTLSLPPFFTPQRTTARLKSCRAEFGFLVNERYPQHLSISSGLSDVWRSGPPLKTGIRPRAHSRGWLKTEATGADGSWTAQRPTVAGVPPTKCP